MTRSTASTRSSGSAREGRCSSYRITQGARPPDLGAHEETLPAAASTATAARAAVHRRSRRRPPSRAVGAAVAAVTRRRHPGQCGARRHVGGVCGRRANHAGSSLGRRCLLAQAFGDRHDRRRGIHAQFRLERRHVRPEQRRGLPATATRRVRCGKRARGVGVEKQNCHRHPLKSQHAIATASSPRSAASRASSRRAPW